MAVAAYYEWDALGRPLEPAQHIREVVEQMRVAFPAAAHTFGWGANDEHYEAEPPEDHTPYSATGWPGWSPQWWVFATDIMHNPQWGVDCNVLFDYWIGEARAGRMPWLKYIIWQATLYDVRNNWKPQANSGHFDHIHLSGRTDYQHIGLGTWSLLPGGDMDTNQSQKLDAIFNAWDQVALDTGVDGQPDQKFTVPLTKLLKAIQQTVTNPPPVKVTIDPAVLGQALALALQDPAVRTVLVEAARDGSNQAEDA